MGEIIREYRLNEIAIAKALERSIGIERIEVRGEGFTLINNDCVVETSQMPDNSVDLIVTSIPFSTQYEYTPSYNDFGHTDDDAHFWSQMDFLTPQLLRVLNPGRWAAVHVKDRIVPGGINGLGFQTLSSFHSDCITHFKKHGFAFMGMKTIVTDVVRENNQTYRLGWTEQCKDGTKMGVGVPEYLLIFRKPPSDNSNSYADKPVHKDKKEWTADGWKNEEGYSRARWQIDAHAFARSSGERLLTAEEIQGLPADQVYRIWRAYNATSLYDFEHHVRIAEGLEMKGALPPTFMLLPPHSWHDDVWSDVARMLTMNTIQSQQGNEMHLCPLQFDIVDRVIAQASEPGEIVFDPFGGLMTVPYRALKAGRKAVAVELNPGYFLGGVKHCEAMAREVAIPSLFDYAGIRAPADMPPPVLSNGELSRAEAEDAFATEAIARGERVA
jgi:DNA modification methylase